MIVEYKSHLDVRFWVNAYKGRHWQVLNPFIIVVNGEEHIIPTEFWTDFASIPRIAWNILDPYSLGYGPVPHDYGYLTGKKTKEYWDEVLLACMEMDKIVSWKKFSAYNAVKLFGGKVYNDYRNQVAKHLLERVPIKSLAYLDWNRNIPLNQFSV